MSDSRSADARATKHAAAVSASAATASAWAVAAIQAGLDDVALDDQRGLAQLGGLPAGSRAIDAALGPAILLMPPPGADALERAPQGHLRRRAGAVEQRAGEQTADALISSQHQRERAESPARRQPGPAGDSPIAAGWPAVRPASFRQAVWPAGRVAPRRRRSVSRTLGSASSMRARHASSVSATRSRKFARRMRLPAALAICRVSRSSKLGELAPRLQVGLGVGQRPKRIDAERCRGRGQRASKCGLSSLSSPSSTCRQSSRMSASMSAWVCTKTRCAPGAAAASSSATRALRYFCCVAVTSSTSHFGRIARSRARLSLEGREERGEGRGERRWIDLAS